MDDEANAVALLKAAVIAQVEANNAVTAAEARLRAARGEGYRIALRPYGDGSDDRLMDDVVVNYVSMFRAEQMDANLWWVCCYLAGSEESITFHFNWNRKTKNLEMHASDIPHGPGITYEDDNYQGENE